MAEIEYPHRTTGDVPRNIAAVAPDRAALIFRSESVTYRAFDLRANQFAHALLTLSNPAPARIAIMSANCLEYAVIHYGAARTKTVLVHLSPRFTPRELAYTLNQTQATFLFGDAAAQGVFQDARPDLEAPPIFIGIGEELPEGIARYTSLVAPQPESDPGIEIDLKDPICILYTSGTTGDPKGAVADHLARIVASTAAMEDIPIGADDICAATIPLCHAAGLYSWFHPIIIAGATAVIMERWDPETFMQAVEDHQISIAFVVPTQLAMLLNAEGFSANRLRSLKRFIYGGAPATDELIRRAEASLPHTDIVQAFGSTETSHLLCQQPAERRAKPGSLGKPGARIEMGVFKSPGVQAPVGEIGEIASRGPHMFTEYLDQSDQTAAYYRSGDGWGWTGDLGTMDADGVLTLVGRQKEIILSGGMNISPVELENAIEDHPAVAACAAFGMADETWGELPAAAVVLKPGAEATADEILSHCAAKVARFKRLRHIEFVDALPHTSSGKVMRTALKERYSKPNG